MSKLTFTNTACTYPTAKMSNNKTIQSENTSDSISTVAGLPEPVLKVVRIAQTKKASDVIVLDLRESEAFTDFFVIFSAENTRQVKAIVNAIEEIFLQSHLNPSHVEGSKHAEWLLMDFFDFVVHVFTHEARNFYGLERLWVNAERIEVNQND